MRQYLLDSLPPAPSGPGQHTTASASPTGPDDEQGWQKWITAFAEVASVLCGPHGDSGFGLSRAHEEAQIRRTAPVAPTRAEHADPDVDLAERAERRSHNAHSTSPTRTNSTAASAEEPAEPRWRSARIAGGVVGLLALRGLHKPRSHDTPPRP